MEPNRCGFILATRDFGAVAASDFGAVAVLIIVALGLAAVMLLLTLVVGPKRHGPVKDSTYESGMTPIGDARRRFNVRFYLVAVMYVVFSVEVVFLYPWAVVFAQQRQGLTAYAAAKAAGTPGQAATGAGTLEQASDTARWAHELAQAGYGPGVMLGAALVFFALLAVGFVYEWRKGVFRWD